MNQGIFRLVYSRVLNMYVPASEAVNARGGKRSDKRVRKLVKKAFVVIFIGSIPYALADSPQGLQLESATGASVASTTRNSMTIQQTVPKAILDWRQLNLKAGELLRFDQGGNRTWSALNRINDIAPSQIFGTIRADGNLYLINPNGIVFGSGSQVNVGGSLYAGSLDITDDLFNRGLLSDPENPVFSATGGFVMVEEGAHLYTKSGGRVVLLAPDVENHGLIETPDGQTILAAGKKVYLQALTSEDTENSKFSDENPAHLLVEVDAGGESKNVGKIVADRGNITMVGLAVNQEGILSASTSVRANGVITLKAADTINTSDVVNEAVKYRPQQGGKVTLAENSVTEVRVEVNDVEEVTQAQLDALPLDKSKVRISGADVEINGQILAKSGEVNISNGPSSDSNNLTMDRVYLGEKSVIDVSGIDATAPMERNQLEIELFSDQLKDVPLLRDSDVFKQTVFVDRRKGTALTDTTPFEQLKTKTIGEILTKGGKVTFGGEVIQREGSLVDVSGGSTTYQAGVIRETALTYNGKKYLISDIDPNTTLPQVSDQVVVSSEKWGTSRVWDLNGRSTKNWGKIQKTSDLDGAVSNQGTWQAGYKEGDDAGEIAHVDSTEQDPVSAFTVMDGTVRAKTYVGETQRLPGQAPLGGKITLTGDFAPTADKLSKTFTFDTEYNQSGLRKFSTDFIKNGFNRIALKGDVNTKLSVEPNGSLSISGVSTSQPANINADIDAPGSNITISGANIAAGVNINSAGNFTNDRPAVGRNSQALATNAGSINVSALNGSIGENVKFDASAGAFVDKFGKLYKGEAGDITITANGQDIKESQTYQAYGFNKGGELTINTTGKVNVSNVALADSVNFQPKFFRQGGFSNYQISTVGDVVVGDGSQTDIYTTMQTLRTDSSLVNKANQRSAVTAASTWKVPANQREASSISLASTETNSELVLNENATIRTDVGGTVTLASERKLAVLGDIDTPAGEINIQLNADPNAGSVPYDRSNGIFIGDKADLTAKGVYRQLPSNNGVLNGEVLSGGNINIVGAQQVGSKGVGTVVVKEGAVLDVSATSGQTDYNAINGIQRETIYGDAGAISISARDGMILDGQLLGKASGTGRAGSLTLTLDTGLLDDNVRQPISGNDFRVTQNKVLRAEGLSYGDPVLPQATTTAQIKAVKGLAQVSAKQISQGGFDNVALQNSFGNNITFEAGTNLKLPGKLTLQASQLAVDGGGTASVNAGHVSISERVTRSNPNEGLAATSIKGDNRLTINADQIAITGNVGFSNVNRTDLNAKLDITGTGLGGFQNTASIKSPGELNLTARQIYPNTANKLSFEATGTDSKITVSSSGKKDTTVLSAQGELVLKADEIEQKNGRLKAPFGSITLDAANKLTLGKNSKTSVSGKGTEIPFATTRLSGKQYSTEAYKGLEGTEQPLEAKSINLKSDVIDHQQGAVVDVSGGGDMFAYEFIEGIGGSEDVLAQDGYFAVLPSLGNSYAPTDSIYQNSSSDIGIGETVYLTGIPGLKAGTYTKLPARYALVKGAYLVKEGISSNLNRGATAKQLDGSYYTTGYDAELATGARDANWSTYQVVSGSIFRPKAGETSKAPSEYLITSAKKFFGGQIAETGVQQQLPSDAGRLSIEATSQLNLSGTINTNKAAGAKGAQVDIASDNIRVVAEKDTADTSLQLTANELNKLNAESLLLGGSRDVDGNTTNINALSKTVTIENDIDNALEVPELIAASTESLTVKSGATILAKNSGDTKGESSLVSTGEGALLAVSGINDISYSRTGNSASASKGSLNIEVDANVQADQSVVLDATKDNQLSGTVKVADGGSATFGANRILLGTPSPTEQGLVISNQTLANLGQLAKFSLSSQSNVDVYGNVEFGNEGLDLTINSAGIAGNMNAGESVNITARNLELNNDNNANYISPSNPENGDLTITATNVKLKGASATNTAANAGKTTLGNFTNVTINSDELRVSKTGQTTFDSETTNLNNSRITADTGANYSLSSDKQLTTAKSLTPLANPNENITTEGIGANLTLTADNLTVGGNIELGAGNVALISEQDLNVETGANISAKSSQLTFNQDNVSTPAGQVTLLSNSGDVNLASDATIDVSATQDAKAGTVNIVATSDSATANIQGSIKGTDEQGDVSGSLNVDVNKLADLTTTNQQASGFGGERRYRIRNEANVEISGKTVDGTALSANKISVTNDGGAITVSGDIDATSQKNGRIDLAAKDDITLLSGGSLTAKSTAVGAEGGTVTVSSQQGRLDFEVGSNIDVSGGEGGEGGDVLARAPLENITTSIQSTVVGAKKRQFAGFAKIQKETITQADVDTNSAVRNIVDPWMQSVQSIDKNGFNFVPEIVVESDSNLTVTGNISLYDWRYDPDTGAAVANNATGKNANGNNLLAGILTLKAKGDLTIDGSLNDGFDADGEVSGHDSASFNVVAGADLDSADQLAVTDNDSTLTVKNEAGGGGTECPFSSPFLCSNGGFLPPGVKASSSTPTGIRTGTGDINIASSGDLVLDNDNTVIYTAGRKAEDLDGFTGPESSLKPLYLTDGGSITLNVNGNVVGQEATDSSRQVVNQWLFRQGGGTVNPGPKDTSWWARLDLFKQSLATFGGGDVEINAGGNIENFSASIATSGRFDSNGNTGNQRIDGGGDLTVKADGDIVNGTYFVANGDGDISAKKAVKKTGNLGTVIALQDGNVSVTTGQSSEIETVVNPTLFAQSSTNVTGISQVQDRGDSAYFNSYSEDSKISVTSLTGDISMSGVSQLLSSSGLFTTDLADKVNGYYPGTVNTTAFGGNVTIKDIRMLPAANGNLSVLANDDINIGNILMSDADLTLFPNPLRPVKRFGFNEAEIRAIAGTPVHINDQESAKIIAQTGSISRTGQNLRDISLAKSVVMYAGQDIDNFSLKAQNLRDSDITIVKAGNDINGSTSTTDPTIKVAGPGEVYVEAGRDIDLGVSRGITTIGNKENPALPEDAASITVIAGLGDEGATIDAYIDRYILPSGAGPKVLQGNANALQAYRNQTTKALTSYIRKIKDDKAITDQAALALFSDLPQESKMIFVNRHLSSELLAAGKDFAKTKSHQRGFDAIATLFPEGVAQGDISLFNSKIGSGTNGSIDVLAPNGLINVGLAGGSDSTDIGIVSEKFGPIRIYADKGIEVNQSKIVTQIDGDMTLWVNNGDIDAGRGSKAATSVPQRIIQTDVDGNTTITNVGVAAGSGIQAQTFDPDGPNGPEVAPKRGTVVAVAPRGVIDAGEAGIVAGDLVVVAPVIANASNISASGSTSGVPAATTNVAAAVGPGADNSTQNAVQEVAQNVAQNSSAPVADDLFPLLVTTRFLGFGDEEEE